MTAVDLVPSWVVGSINLTDYPFSVDANSTVDIGEPEMVVEGVASLLADGDMEKVTRHGNRTYVLPVYIEGPTMTDLAQSEALLRAEIRKDGLLLTHDPGDGLTPSSAYEVWTAKLTPERRDDHESHLLRKFTLTLTCSPFARSVDAVTIDALAAPAGSATVTTIDDCNSATGWTALVDSTPATVDLAWSPGAVSVHELLNTAPQQLTLTRTGSVNFSTTRYLVIEVGYNASFGAVPVTASSGVTPLKRLSQRQTEPGWYECIYETGAATLPSLTFSAYFPQEYADLKIRKVSRTDAPPSTSPRQLTRIIEPGGTERTPASIHVAAADGTTPLGLTIVHTSPDDGSGYAPPMRRWRTGGNTVTTDTTTVSGAREPLHPAAVTYEVPTSSLPEGGYLLCAYVRVDVAGRYAVYFASTTRMPAPNASTYLGPVINQVGIDFPVANQWVLVPLGIMSLPTVRTKAGKVYVGIQRANLETVNMQIDEAWLFRVDDDCALSVGPVAAANLWLDSPDVSSPVPTVWMGDSRDAAANPGGDFISGNHVLHPDGTTVMATTLGGEWPRISAEFYRRWHSNAAE